MCDVEATFDNRLTTTLATGSQGRPSGAAARTPGTLRPDCAVNRLGVALFRQRAMNFGKRCLGAWLQRDSVIHAADGGDWRTAKLIDVPIQRRAQIGTGNE
jgi:hypothetical protein